MAIFPEDVPVPASVFDLLATTIFGASSKRPQLQIRSWLTALIRLSLVIGSLGDGVFMHDIVRDYSMSRCADLRTQHREFLAALLDAAPPSGWPALFSVGRHKRGSPERYVGSHVRWHMQHAVDPTQVDDELAERLCRHSVGFMFSICSVLGFEETERRIGALEAAGHFMSAATYAVGIAQLHQWGDGRIKQDLQLEGEDLLKAVRLLAKMDDDPDANFLENEIFARLVMLAGYGVGSFSDPELVKSLQARYEVLDERRFKVDGHTYEYMMKKANAGVGKALVEMMEGFNKMSPGFKNDEADEMLLGSIGLALGVWSADLVELLRRSSSAAQDAASLSLGFAYLEIGALHASNGEQRISTAFGVQSIDEIYEAYGGRERVVRAARNREFDEVLHEGSLAMYNFFLSGMLTRVLAEWGELHVIGEWVNNRVEGQKKLNEAVRNGEASDVQTRDQWYSWSMAGRELKSYGLLELSQRILMGALSVHTWLDGLELFNEAWK